MQNQALELIPNIGINPHKKDIHLSQNNLYTNMQHLDLEGNPQEFFGFSAHKKTHEYFSRMMVKVNFPNWTYWTSTNESHNWSVNTNDIAFGIIKEPLGKTHIILVHSRCVTAVMIQ